MEKKLSIRVTLNYLISYMVWINISILNWMLRNTGIFFFFLSSKHWFFLIIAGTENGGTFKFMEAVIYSKANIKSSFFRNVQILRGKYLFLKLIDCYWCNLNYFNHFDLKYCSQTFSQNLNTANLRLEGFVTQIIYTIWVQRTENSVTDYLESIVPISFPHFLQ